MAKSTDRRPPSLGIEGLPLAADSMCPGGAYAISCRQSAMLAPLLAGMVARALAGRRPVLLVAGADCDAVTQLLPAHGIDVAAELASRRLLCLAQSAAFEARLPALGPQRYLEELEHHCDQRGRLVLITGADALLTAQTRREATQQARLYSHGFADSRATGVLLFTQTGSAVKAQGRLLALEGWFAGLAHLRSDGTHLVWDVEYWRSTEGSVGARQYGLRLTPAGAALEADGAQISVRDLRIVEAADYAQVYLLAARSFREKGRPESWQPLPDAAAMLATAPAAVAATYVIETRPDQPIDQLAQLVHGLRVAGGRGVKIIVRERSLRLRHNQEILLQRLGANIVADSALSFSRVLGLIESIRDRSFEREVLTDFAAALIAALPPAGRGYLPPMEFAAAVREANDRAAPLGLASSLVRLVISPQLPHLDVLRQIHASRPGDLFTADDRSVLVFLFACPDSDIDTALARIVGVPLAELFDAQLRSVGTDAIATALTALERQLRLTTVVDFSTLLPPPVEVAPMLEPIPAPSSALPEATALPMHAVVAAARRVSRASLPLRT